MVGPMANCIDYFATLGRPSENEFVAKRLESEPDSGEFDIHPRDLWQEAITDLTMIHEGEEVPEGECTHLCAPVMCVHCFWVCSTWHTCLIRAIA